MLIQYNILIDIFILLIIISIYIYLFIHIMNINTLLGKILILYLPFFRKLGKEVILLLHKNDITLKKQIKNSN